ncbi:MAG: hypothetical protein IJ762_08185 [Bacteroidaceae bacterium]|nr:hypothetical protein [Bacteroidaceae bacterium]
MKRKYIRPATEALRLRLQAHMLESTYVPIGGGGGFDVKRHQGNWEIEWEGTYSDEEEEETRGIFS